MTIDPLEILVAGGLGWLLPKLAFVREPIEYVTGDPASVKETAESWRRLIGGTVTPALEEAASARTGAVFAWDGEGTPGFVDLTEGLFGEMYESLEAGARVEGALRAIAELIDGVRTIVIDEIARLMSVLVVRFIERSAEATFTAGFSYGVFAAESVAEAARTVAECHRVIGETLARILGIIDALRPMVAALRVIDAVGVADPPGGEAAAKMIGVSADLLGVGKQVGMGIAVGRAVDAVASTNAETIQPDGRRSPFRPEDWAIG